MSTSQKTPPSPAEEAERDVPRPPSRQETEEISRDQALITDEWTGEQPAPKGPGGTELPA